MRPFRGGRLVQFARLMQPHHTDNPRTSSNITSMGRVDGHVALVLQLALCELDTCRAQLITEMPRPRGMNSNPAHRYQ